VAGTLARNERLTVDGVLLLDKPIGCTSNHALQRVKRMFNARKAGHTGSLDPLASGMLPICFGEATKVSAFLLDSDKTYQVTATLGQCRDTADAEGKVTAQAEVPSLDESAVREVLEGFLGPGEQVPPMYSALKVGGRRLYELARSGQDVARAPRPIDIKEIALLRLEPGSLAFRVRCSKGTYVRTLVEDVARRLGTLGYVSELRRTGVAAFAGAEMWTLERLEALAEEGRLAQALLPVDEALREWPSLSMDSGAIDRLLQGQRVAAPGSLAPGHVRLYEDRRGFAGVVEACQDGSLVPRRMFPALRGKSPTAQAK